MIKHLVICLLLVVTSGTGLSENQNNNPFRPSYLGVSFSIHEPTSPTNTRYQAPNHNGSGPLKVGIKYLHILPHNWQSGFEFNFKEFADKEDQSTSLILSAITHKIGYIYRFNYPFYLMTSFKGIYLSPVEAGIVPYKRDESKAIEVGAGLAAEIIYIYNPYVLLSTELLRWRGTGSKDFQGYEILFSALWSIEYD